MACKLGRQCCVKSLLKAQRLIIKIPFDKPCVITLLLSLLTTAAHAQEVRLPMQTNEKNNLTDLLIAEAIQRSSNYTVAYPYGDIEHLPLSKRINDVRNGELDAFYAMTSPEYEEEFQAVYVPLYRGLMGMRLAIVKRENQQLFASVKTLNQLKQYSAGQGKFWADAKILQQNGLPTVLELKYPNLFRMLEAERFDYFPRGIHEPWSEIEKWHALDLSVEPNIMLHYTAPFYCFVNKNNPQLAQHITEQLHGMIDEGRFQVLFENDAKVKSALQQANIHQRHILKIDNPYLSQHTPLDNPKLWLKPEDIQ